MKRMYLIMSLVILIFTMVSCSKQIDFSKLDKSSYENIKENEEISLTIKETEISSDTQEVTLVCENNTDKEYIYGNEVHLDIKHKGEWYVVPVMQKVGWNEIGIVLAGKSKNQNSISIKDYYGKLENGEYRFVKELYYMDEVIVVKSEFEVK